MSRDYCVRCEDYRPCKCDREAKIEILTSIIKKLMAGNYKQFTPEELDIMCEIKDAKTSTDNNKGE